jgi:hypothetical protein
MNRVWTRLPGPKRKHLNALQRSGSVKHLEDNFCLIRGLDKSHLRISNIPKE